MSARLVIAIGMLAWHGPPRLSLFNPRSIEEAVQKMIEASRRMIMINSQGELGGINPAINKHLELEIKTLQDVLENMQT